MGVLSHAAQQKQTADRGEQYRPLHHNRALYCLPPKYKLPSTFLRDVGRVPQGAAPARDPAWLPCSRGPQATPDGVLLLLLPIDSPYSLSHLVPLSHTDTAQHAVSPRSGRLLVLTALGPDSHLRTSPLQSHGRQPFAGAAAVEPAHGERVRIAAGSQVRQVPRLDRPAGLHALPLQHPHPRIDGAPAARGARSEHVPGGHRKEPAHTPGQAKPGPRDAQGGNQGAEEQRAVAVAACPIAVATSSCWISREAAAAPGSQRGKGTVRRRRVQQQWELILGRCKESETSLW